ncbi:hypothetical protein C8Q70DRAFT_34108 [Cubamyces menziesii]|nr:hypothetical protein C8Q70DRAFT_34108 [Cubamyces menziesii]
MWVHRLIQTPLIAPPTVVSHRTCINRQCTHGGRKQVSAHTRTTVVGEKTRQRLHATRLEACGGSISAAHRFFRSFLFTSD